MTPRFLAVCLVLGCVTTVALAWLLTLDFHRGMKPMTLASTGQTARGIVTISRRDSLGAIALAASDSLVVEGTAHNQFVALEKAVPSWASEELLGWSQRLSDPALPSGSARGIVASGWPLLSMWSSFDQQPSTGYWWYKARNGFVVGPPPATPNYFALLSPRERTLPTRIIWHGFAISMLFWSLVWMILLLGPGLARRAYRRKRNRCTACGYSRAGLADAAACPECGLSREH